MSIKDESKEDGRKTRGARPVYFVCAAIVAEKIVSELIQTSDKDEASHTFKARHKHVPSMVLGPFYEVKGTGAPVTEPATISVPLKNIDMTGKRWEGVYKGWSVIANGLKASEEFKNDELVLVFLGEAVTKDATRPRFGKGPSIIKRELLENVKSL